MHTDIAHLPQIALSEGQRIWLQEAWRQLLDTGNNPSYKSIKLKTLKEVGPSFNVHDIDERLLRERATQPTLLGVLYADTTSKILDDADRIILTIKQILIDQPDREEFSTAEIAPIVGFDKKYTQIVFTLASEYGSFWNSAGSTNSADNPFGYERFSVKAKESHAFDFYIEFTSIRNCMEAHYIRQEKYERSSSTHSSNYTVGLIKTTSSQEVFVDPIRLNELKNIGNSKFDLTRLIRQCEELNDNYANECFFAVGMLTRSIIDHIPPVFGKINFSDVAGGYGAKSFKESMSHLDKSSRKIADSFLHTQIRQKEVLPTRTQVNFSRDFDVLLAEIVRILR